MRKALITMLFPEPPPAKRMFDPPPRPLPPRELSDRPVCEQAQSLFLTRLPAEVRNEIYEFVFYGSRGPDEGEEMLGEIGTVPFIPVSVQEGSYSPWAETGPEPGTGSTVEPEQEPQLVPKPDLLALLLTCRRINLEATNLAFSLHTFTIRRTIPTYHALSRQTSLLVSCQVSAITSLAYDVPRRLTSGKISHGSTFIASALLMYPALRKVSLRMRRSFGDDTDSSIHRTILVKPVRVMSWLWVTLQKVCIGREIGTWPSGQAWSIEWPQMEADKDIADYIENTYMEFPVSNKAVRVMHDIGSWEQGIEPCICGCGAPSWLHVELAQENGRKVKIEVGYYGDWKESRKRELLWHKVKLVPGVERLAVRSSEGKVVVGGEGLLGFGWDGEAG